MKHRATTPWAEIYPYREPHIATYDTPEQMAVCFSCELPPDACGTNACPFGWAQLLGKRIDNITYQLGPKQVHQIAAEIREELKL